MPSSTVLKAVRVFPPSIQLSGLGQLGHKAHSAVVNGEALDDETIVNILTTEMRGLPDGSAFILDNFPLTMNQMIVSESYSIHPLYPSSLRYSSPLFWV